MHFESWAGNHKEREREKERNVMKLSRRILILQTPTTKDVAAFVYILRGS